MIDELREKFEAWAKAQSLNITRARVLALSDYAWPTTEHAWQAFQAGHAVNEYTARLEAQEAGSDRVRLLSMELELARHLLRIAEHQGVHWKYGQDDQEREWDRSVSQMLSRAMP